MKCGLNLESLASYQNYLICEQHLKLLSDKRPLSKTHPKYCFFPGHGKGWTCAKNLTASIDLEDSQNLMKYANILVPFTSKICSYCNRYRKKPKLQEIYLLIADEEKVAKEKAVEKKAAIEKAEAQLAEESGSDDNNSFHGSEDNPFDNIAQIGGYDDHEMEIHLAESDTTEGFTSGSEASPPKKKSKGSSGDSWKENFRDKLSDMRSLLNQLIKRNKKSDVKVKYTTDQRVSDMKPSTYYEVLRNAGASIASVIHTLSSKLDDDANLWRAIKESRIVEKFLASTPEPDSLVKEVIKAYNACDDRRLRIQILSILGNDFTYPMIARYNSKNYKDTSSVSKQEREEEERQGDCNESKQNDTIGLTFNPPVSRYIFRKAKIHYRENKRAFAPVPKPIYTRWHWDLETVEAIVDFVTDPMNTQQVRMNESIKIITRCFLLFALLVFHFSLKKQCFF